MGKVSGGDTVADLGGQVGIYQKEERGRGAQRKQHVHQPGMLQELRTGHSHGGPIWECGREQDWRYQSTELDSRRALYAGPMTLDLVLR